MNIYVSISPLNCKCHESRNFCSFMLCSIWFPDGHFQFLFGESPTSQTVDPLIFQMLISKKALTALGSTNFT